MEGSADFLSPHMKVEKLAALVEVRGDRFNAVGFILNLHLDALQLSHFCSECLKYGPGLGLHSIGDGRQVRVVSSGQVEESK